MKIESVFKVFVTLPIKVDAALPFLDIRQPGICNWIHS